MGAESANVPPLTYPRSASRLSERWRRHVLLRRTEPRSTPANDPQLRPTGILECGSLPPLCLVEGEPPPREASLRKRVPPVHVATFPGSSSLRLRRTSAKVVPLPRPPAGLPVHRQPAGALMHALKKLRRDVPNERFLCGKQRQNILRGTSCSLQAIRGNLPEANHTTVGKLVKSSDGCSIVGHPSRHEHVVSGHPQRKKR